MVRHTNLTNRLVHPVYLYQSQVECLPNTGLNRFQLTEKILLNSITEYFGKSSQNRHIWRILYSRDSLSSPDYLSVFYQIASFKFQKGGDKRGCIGYVNKAGTGPDAGAPIENMRAVFRCCYGYFVIMSIVYKYREVVCQQKI